MSKKNLYNAMKFCPAAFEFTGDDAEKFCFFSMPGDWGSQLYEARKVSGYHYEGYLGRSRARNFVNSVVRTANKMGVHCNLVEC